MSHVAAKIFHESHEIMGLDSNEENCKLNMGGKKQGEGAVLPANSDYNEAMMDPKRGHWKRRAGATNTGLSPTSSDGYKKKKGVVEGVDGEVKEELRK